MYGRVRFQDGLPSIFRYLLLGGPARKGFLRLEGKRVNRGGEKLTGDYPLFMANLTSEIEVVSPPQHHEYPPQSS